MGLTTQKLQSQIVPQEARYYYKVTLEDGSTRCCGSSKDLNIFLDNYDGVVWEKVYLPSTPDTIDVPHISVGHEQALPMQQILPESQQEPLEL